MISVLRKRSRRKFPCNVGFKQFGGFLRVVGLPKSPHEFDKRGFWEHVVRWDDAEREQVSACVVHVHVYPSPDALRSQSDHDAFCHGVFDAVEAEFAHMPQT